MTSDEPTIPGYEIVRQIGAGGSSTVWAVRRPDGVRLAVKVLREDQRRPESAWSAEVEHEHLLPVWDTVIGRWDDRDVTCLVMPLAEGGSLQDVLDVRGHLTVGEIVTVLVPLAQALHHLHSVGLVHGDLKPANVLLTADGRPLLADLGAARLPVDVADSEVWATDRWSAPEVLQGQPADAASDAYGLGAIAWACATGSPAPPAALRPLLADEATHLPQGVCDVITACLSHTAAARPSPAEFADLIWSCASAEPAPVALSPGARTAMPVRDPGDELTRRLRSQARTAVLTEPNERTSRRWRRRPVESTPVVPIQPAVPGSRRQARAVAGRPTRRRGWWLDRRIWAAAGLAACTPTGAIALLGPAQSAPTPPAVRAVPTTSATVTTASSPSAGARSLSTATGNPLPDPVAALQRLLSARAVAWNHGDTSALGGAFAANSTAWQRDSGDIKTVVNRSAHYSGLAFRVREAQVTSRAADRASVRAQVVRTAATVTVGGTRRVVPEQISTVDFELVRTAAGWRINDWRSS
ncbi:serine/threonine protein kinase [Branchiibius hedensis]|uniref:non-specific serine/threonine protein kinase n=1 Tax=Branchiibius hedensis TaxID=672460 RepID=A0A2Y8ZUR4_9MICO|nr:serine/threonine-protein kinase [Branchiibius hedensis]PWJ24790.1 serine/threonine protein kinase [Branchiibius hedensis]SSA33607.1 Serine/threonine protein kinase [Branchiibius hedensis]